jgi:N-acetylglucosaminyl-diphospho-decaprenol L-rhamnosyltransferase
MTAVDVAIVNWNTAEAALAAAAAYLDSEGVDARVTVVDNASRAEQRRLLGERFPAGARLELSDENRGYGAAANAALRGGDAELVCISNADIVPEPGALAALAAAALGEPAAGMVGPAFGGETDRYHAKLPSAAAMLGRILVGSFARGAVAPPAPAAVMEVEQPSGACFVLRREVWERVGGFDEGFFLWYEDVDLAKRLRAGGFRNLVVGSARVAHAGARAFAQVGRPEQQRIRLDAVERYIDKHHARAKPLARPLLKLARRLRARR